MLYRRSASTWCYIFTPCPRLAAAKLLLLVSKHMSISQPSHWTPETFCLLA